MTDRRSPRPPSSPIEIVRQCFACWSAGDMTGVLDYIDPDCEYDLHVPTDVLVYGGRHRGKPAIADCLEAIRREFHYMAYAIGALKQEGNLVRGQIIFYFKDRETGEIFDGRCRHRTTVKGHLIVEIEEFHDVEKLRAFVQLARSRHKK